MGSHRTFTCTRHLQVTLANCKTHTTYKIPSVNSPTPHTVHKRPLEETRLCRTRMPLAGHQNHSFAGTLNDEKSRLVVADHVSHLVLSACIDPLTTSSYLYLPSISLPVCLLPSFLCKVPAFLPSPLKSPLLPCLLLMLPSLPFL